jgi:hypothetical protein
VIASPEPQDNGQGTFTDPDASVFLPNAPSEPVWSLAADATSPAISKQHEAVKPVDEGVSSHKSDPVLREQETAMADAPAAAPPVGKAQAETSGPAKKGWWQRPFRG